MDSDERITRLHDVVPELQSTATESAVYDWIIDAAVKTLGFDSCAVCIPDDGIFDERAVSESAPFDEGTRSFKTDEGMIGKAFQTGESFSLDNAFENEDAKPSDESSRPVDRLHHYLVSTVGRQSDFPVPTIVAPYAPNDH